MIARTICELGSPPNLGDFDCHAAGATWAARGCGVLPVGRRGARLIERQPAVRFPRSVQHAVQGCQPAPLFTPSADQGGGKRRASGLSIIGT